MENRKIYVDNAATTRVSCEVLNSMLPFFNEEFGNPSSIHDYGYTAKNVLEKARERIAESLKCHSDEIYFTSGATESNNWAIRGILETSNKKTIITSMIEHPSVLNTCKKLETNGFHVKYLATDASGEIITENLTKSINEDTALIAVMAVNNETGVVQPIKEISRIAHDAHIPFFTDAAHAIGNISLDLNENTCDLLSLSGHKIKAPKGIGLLYVKRGIIISPLLSGGGQERGFRSGTENVPYSIGLSIAIEHEIAALQKKYKIQRMKEILINCINSIPMSFISGSSVQTIPGTVHVCFDQIEGSDLVRLLNQFGIFASSSSACSTRLSHPSHVLLAMGIPYERAKGSLRLSINEYNTIEEIEYITKILPQAVSQLRKMNPH